MTISEVWQKYKHLDEYFTHKKWVGTEEMVHTIFFEMWEAIKEAQLLSYRISKEEFESRMGND